MTKSGLQYLQEMQPVRARGAHFFSLRFCVEGSNRPDGFLVFCMTESSESAACENCGPVHNGDG